jgi:hypothetical protein
MCSTDAIMMADRFGVMYLYIFWAQRFERKCGTKIVLPQNSQGPNKARQHLAYGNGVYPAVKTSYHYQLF